MSHFKDQEQAAYTADPAAVDLSVIIETYKALLSGDNLPERVAVQTVVLQTLLDAAAATTAKPVEVAAWAQHLLTIWDQWFSCERKDEAAREQSEKLIHAACFAGVAYEDAVSAPITADKAPADLLRTFLIALIDMSSALLDPYRAKFRPNVALSPAAPVDQWQDITTIGEREHGRLIIVGTRDGKGRWCATIRRTTRVIEERNSSITGALKNTMRLKWEPTHFIELTALNSVAGK